MLRFLCFVYDVMRFVLMTLLLGAAGSFERNADAYFFPLIAYTAQIALFPVMSFFLWVEQEKYSNFKMLYCAGKIFSVCAIIAALAPAASALLQVMPFWDKPKWIVNMIFPLIALFDIFTILILFLRKKTAIENDGSNSSSAS
ncbi:MAG: FUSC family protein [Spirochaetaceae bacterium]|nr:FUSC family protein [Spirochaetaceae bacterium]